MALFDWVGRRRASGSGPNEAGREVRVDGGLLLIESAQGETLVSVRLDAARSVRVVPLSGGSHHVQASGWQVTLARADGDVLLGPPLASWQAAREFARQVCTATRLPLDELTERLFSRVGRLDL
ncbi:MAG: hypothetical protein JO352_05810 [Chloroflexi bacterium]|nr:hypothetical protein [Chloroflexota bacterium]MBV9596352.1 hypothetical protein [Chloroflexota bacterium]